MEIQLEMYNSMVSSVQMYATEVRGHNVKDMGLLHTKFLKHILFVHIMKTRYYIVCGELEVYPLQVNINCRMINLWVKLLAGRNNKLSYLIH